MKKYLIKTIYFGIALACLLAVLGVSAWVCGLTSPAVMPTYDTATEFNTVMKSVNILDIEGAKKITAFNVVKGEFVKNVNPEGVEYSHDISDLGNKGTIQILIGNLDPNDADYLVKESKLEYLKNADYYELSVYIPTIRSASVVYASTQLLSVSGEIENYNFYDFYASKNPTENHINQTNPVTLDVKLLANRRFMGPTTPVRNGMLITIHYEAEEGKVAVVDGEFLVGQREMVESVVNQNYSSIFSVLILGIAVLAILIFVSVLKKRWGFLPYILFALGIVGVCACSVVYSSACSQPYYLLSFRNLFVGVVTVGATLTCCKKIDKFPVRACLFLIGLSCCVIGFVSPFTGVEAETVLNSVGKVLNILLLVGVSATLGYGIIKGDKIDLGLSGLVAMAFLGLGVLDRLYLTFLSPSFVICVLLLGITAWFSFREFVIMENRNKFLTANLEDEVKRQTESLTQMVGERDGLLRYISHDLRKPIVGIKKNLALVVDEDEHTRNSAMQNVTAKLNSIEDGLSEISKYSKTNYNLERSCVLGLNQILSKLYSYIEPDCVANSIRLSVASTDIEVFAKPNALYSILSNLVFNALEHANCTRIEVSAHKNRNQCAIIVEDDGKGVETPEKLFTPYSPTQKNSENLGIGLFIARQFALNMGGDLSYERIDSKTRFTLTLPLV